MAIRIIPKDTKYMVFVVFPNQLFPPNILKKTIEKGPVYLVEEPAYFGTERTGGKTGGGRKGTTGTERTGGNGGKIGGGKLKFNKIKLIYNRACMKFYEKELKKAGFSVKYVEFSKADKFYEGKNIECFDIVDIFVEKKLSGLVKSIKVVDSPMFLLKNPDIEEISEKFPEGKPIRHTKFLKYVKEKLDILVGVKSYDKDNRRKLPKGVDVPGLKALSASDRSLLRDAERYVERVFAGNFYDFPESEVVFPCSRKGAKAWLGYFIKRKFKFYGKYQDAISKKDHYLFHSTISPMLNVGLLTPMEVVDATRGLCEKVGVENYEGFLRQLIGWREYQRFLYRTRYDEMIKGNFFGNSLRIDRRWYEGDIGISVVDDSIRQAFRFGYIHHIVRLMVMANFMNLCRLVPNDVYRWFMEFSLDSYDWVMIQNVYGMGMWSDGGLSMRKPYISSDAYIEKMSDYKLNPDEKALWRSLYYNFLLDNEKKLKGTPYLRNLAYLKKRTKEERREILDPGKRFL